MSHSYSFAIAHVFYKQLVAPRHSHGVQCGDHRACANAKLERFRVTVVQEGRQFKYTVMGVPHELNQFGQHD